VAKRRGASLSERREIRDRLDGLISRYYKTRAAFSREMDKRSPSIPGSTIRGWFRRDPTVPEVHSLLILGRRCGWSPTYVLFGTPPALLSHDRQAGPEALPAFAAIVTHRLSLDLDCNPDLVRAILGRLEVTPERLFTDTVEKWRPIVGPDVARKRRKENFDKGGTDYAMVALAATGMIMKEDADITTLPSSAVVTDIASRGKLRRLPATSERER